MCDGLMAQNPTAKENKEGNDAVSYNLSFHWFYELTERDFWKHPRNEGKTVQNHFSQLCSKREGMPLRMIFTNTGSKSAWNLTSRKSGEAVLFFSIKVLLPPWRFRQVATPTPTQSLTSFEHCVYLKIQPGNLQLMLIPGSLDLVCACLVCTHDYASNFWMLLKKPERECRLIIEKCKNKDLCKQTSKHENTI